MDGDKVPKIALILAGGKGERLRPITYSIPKPLVMINGKPTIVHVINEIKRNGISDIAISLGYKAGKIMKFLGNGKRFGVKLRYYVESEPLGTGGAVKRSLRMIRRAYRGDVFVVYGDDVFRFDVRKLYALHRRMKALATFALKRISDVSGSGVVVLRHSRIVEFVEKPEPKMAPSNIINMTKYIVNTKIVDVMPRKRNFSFERDFLQKNVGRFRFYGYLTKGPLFRTDNIERLNEARARWKA